MQHHIIACVRKMPEMVSQPQMDEGKMTSHDSRDMREPGNICPDNAECHTQNITGLLPTHTFSINFSFK